MNDKKAQTILDTIVGQIFGFKNPYSLEQFQQKYAFDVQLPVQVNDATTGEATWAQSPNPAKFMTLTNTMARAEVDDWMLPKQPIKTVQDILAQWEKVNYTATERQIDSLHFAGSDNIYNSENVYRSQDIIDSKNVVFCDGVSKSEYMAASQRAHICTYAARIEDSKECSESFSVSWSARVVKSLFIHNSADLFECMFCSHIRAKKFCIANMQFEEAEYYKIKKMVVEWILTQ